MKFVPRTGEQKRSPIRMRTRLTLSHIFVGLVGILLILVFASLAMLQAARHAVEDQLASLAIASSQALSGPLEDFLSAERKSSRGPESAWLDAIANEAN